MFLFLKLVFKVLLLVLLAFRFRGSMSSIMEWAWNQAWAVDDFKMFISSSTLNCSHVFQHFLSHCLWSAIQSCNHDHFSTHLNDRLAIWSYKMWLLTYDSSNMLLFHLFIMVGGVQCCGLSLFGRVLVVCFSFFSGSVNWWPATKGLSAING